MDYEKFETYAKKIQKMYFEDLRLCGCGSPDLRLKFIKGLLNLINDRYEQDLPYEEYKKRLAELFGFKENKEAKYYFTGIQDGIVEFVLDQLNEAGLLEHGGSVGGSWLSDYGKEMLNILNEINEEEFDAYLDY
ncbi:hypothetical protein [Parageobacillus galactosidasius]|uniref:Uncharacterized protein n=1 Tax=Parageobacillus galactosidasius TaxID=883812 RepID=A0A226QQL0_9BACL|nr:hypothetical protein [Parageobacillus galactosidasius]OXB94826.1 hypothetical protein B9L23_08160 [Parageobacillus galactosidasius]